jgi:hypothetical protein
VKGAKVANEVLTTGGRTIINTMGAQAAYNSRRGTFADSQDGAAKMAKTTQTYETALGVANLAATAKLQLAARKHKKALGELRSISESTSSGSTYDNGGASLQDAVISKARLKEAEDEQSGAKNLASTAAMKTAIQGVQSLVAARVAKTMANQAKDNAKEARENDALAAQAIFNYDANQLAPGTTTGYDPNAAAISGTTSSSTSDTTELTDQDLPRQVWLKNLKKEASVVLLHMQA